MKPLDPRLLRHARAARGFLAAQVVLGLLRVVLVLAFSALVAAAVVSGAELVGASPEWPVEALEVMSAERRLMLLLTALAGVVLLRAVLTWGEEVLAARAAARVKSQLRAAGVRALARAGDGGLDAADDADGSGRGVGGGARAATTLGGGLDALDAYFSRHLPQLVLTVLAVPVHLLVLALLDLTTAIIVAVTMPLIPLFMVLVGWTTQSAQRRQRDRLDTLGRRYLDVVEGLSTLRVFGRAHHQRENLHRLSAAHRRSTMAVLRVSFLSGFVLELAASLSTALVAVSIGIRLVDGQLVLLVGLTALLIVPEAFAPLRQVGATYHAAADGLAAAEEVFALIARGEAATSRSADEQADEQADGGDDAPHAPQIPPGAELDVAGLSVDRGGRRVLDGVELTARPGELTVLTGPSGVGKSTLFAALLGLVPAAGTARLHGPEGEVPLTRAAIAWSGQDHGLRAGTVAENVALGEPAASRADGAGTAGAADAAGADAPSVRAALAAADLAALDPRRPLGVRGAGLSGGQAHRVALARALHRARARDCPVLLLDEPSAALDAEAEQRLLATLRAEAAADRVVLVISHRPAVVAAADRRIDLIPGADSSAAAATAAVATQGGHR